MPTNEEFLERIQIASPNAFEQVYKNAKKLEDALQKGDQTKLERMDFSTEPMVCGFYLRLFSTWAREVLC